MISFPDDAQPDAGRQAADLDGSHARSPLGYYRLYEHTRPTTSEAGFPSHASPPSLQPQPLSADERAWIEGRDPSIRPAGPPTPPTPRPAPSLTYREGGTLVEIDTGIRPRRPGPAPEQRTRSRNGPWNWRMRGRMLQSCATLRADAPCAFITLSYALKAAPSAATCRAQRKQFFRDMADRFPGVGFHYRIDRQKNTTLHAHLLASNWTVREAQAGRELWLKASGQADNPHARRRAYDVREADGGAAGYAAHYSAKLSSGADNHDPDDGQLWGVRNAKALPLAPEVVIPLTTAQAVALVQVTRINDEARAAAAGWRGTPPSSPHKRTLIQPEPERWAEIHEVLHGGA